MSSRWLTGLISRFCLILLIKQIELIYSTAPVRIAVLLPTDNQYPYSMDKVKPAIKLAVDEVLHRRLLIDEKEFEVGYGDTRSSYIVGPLLAIDFYANRQANVFLGPVDGPGLAAVAR